jgi:hypothetical protein
VACLCAKASLRAGLTHTGLHSLCISCACVHTHRTPLVIRLSWAEVGEGRSSHQRRWPEQTLLARDTGARSRKKGRLSFSLYTLVLLQGGVPYDGFVHKDRPFPHLEVPCI